ncbi:pentatricopeptide repeat (PPR) superfamily protein [Actinidia rufa]|uniref:Pentatricopeptide repeat (PPR) superfamily protein n=1 Tax=Actinidia rufa TaxID=165716 RepID=A0A7J0EXA2_9ERIC|nr:pentatricopeptide repeat (PPR) superfamily protein [Actinidia rufa]
MPSLLIPKNRFQQVSPNPGQPFVPFSQLQQWKLIESRFVSLLHDCDDIPQIKRVHGPIVRKGLDQCCFVLAKLVRTVIKVGAPMDLYPCLVFEQVKQPNPFLWTALIRGYSIQGPFTESVTLYKLYEKRWDWSCVVYVFGPAKGLYCCG